MYHYTVFEHVYGINMVVTVHTQSHITLRLYI